MKNTEEREKKKKNRKRINDCICVSFTRATTYNIINRTYHLGGLVAFDLAYL